MPIYNVQAPNGKTYKVEGPENADPKTLFGFVQQQVESDDVRRLQKEYGPGVLGTFGRGVKRGAGQLASTFTDIIPAMAGSALGYDDYAKEQLAEAEAKSAAREAESPTMFRSYKEVEGIGDFPRFVAETVGEQVPNIATALIPGVGAGALATRAGIGAAGKAAAVGAGAYLGSYAQNAPEIFQNIYENTGQLEPGASVIWGAGSAALDSVLPARLAKQLTGPMKMGIVEKVLEKSGMDKSLLRSTLSGMATAAPIEGLTEGAQEAISIAAEKFVSDNPQIFGSKEWDRIMESAVKGAVGGGAFGTVGGASAYGQAGAQRRAEYADALERRGERQLAAEVRRQSAEIEAIQAQNPQMDLPGFEAGPASGLYTPPVPEPAGPKELKGKQGELFTPEGELTPGVAKAATRDEKIQANKQRQEAQRQAAEVKEAQAKLKKFLSAKQMDLPGFDETSIKDLQAQTAAQQQAAVESGQGDLFAPQPVQPITTPAVAPQVQPAPPSTLLNDAVLKDMGIGHTSLIRRNKILEGKDIANPEDAAEVKRILEAYVENRSQPIREKVEAFLARPEFQGETDVARPDTATGGGGPSVVSKPVPAGVAQADEGFVGDRDVSADQNVGDIAVREGQQPTALEAAPVETPTEVLAEPQQLGKRAQKDLAKAEAGAAAAQQEQATFVQEVDQNVDAILTSRLREAGREAGLNDADLPSETYRGSDAHSLLRLPHLFAQYRDSKALAKESAGTPQEAKNLQQMQQIEEEIAKSGPDALAMFQQLRDLPINRQDQMLSQVNRLALQEFDKTAQETVAKVRAEIAAQQDKSTKRKELTDEELDALTNDFNVKFFEKTGRRLFLPAYQGPAFNEADIALAQNGDLNGLLRSMLDQIKDPDIKQVLRRLRSLNLKTKIVIGNPEGPLALGKDVAYHAGDLGYGGDTTLGRIMGGRSTGHFGTGVYFTGAPVEPSTFLVQDTRPLHKVDLSKFNLAKPRIEYNASNLHDGLKQVNRLVEQDPNNDNYQNTLDTAVYKLDMSSVVKVPRQELRNIIERAVNEAAADIQKFNAAFESYYLDSASTRVMKALGYEGVDVRGIKGFDNREYGTVVYADSLEGLQTTSQLAFGKAGSYDPATDTITLDPQNGLNAHTFIHESLHAAISHVLANPNHPLTKEFNKFFMQIKDRMGAAYGAQDLQEFAAELVGNPSFQALLKTIKTPKSDSLFKAIMRSIAEFFGFVPKTTAFDTGLKFINNAIDISGDVQPTASEKMFLGIGNFPAVGAIGQAMPSLTGRAVEGTKNFLSNLQNSGVQGAAFGLLRLDNINQMYGKELPSIQTLLNALEKRNGTQERMIKTVNSNYHDFRKVEQKYRPQMQRMSDIAIDARLAQVDLLNPNFQPNASNRAEYTRLSTAFRALPKEVQDVYRTIRQAYDSSFNQYMKILHDAATSVSPSLAARLNEQFTAQKPLVGYVPFLRTGDFWVEFTDPNTGEPAAQAFESLRERQQFMDTALRGIPHRAYQNLDDARFTGEGLPPTSFIMQVMNGLRQNNASQEQLNNVYQAYLTTFPAQSIMKQFMKAKNVAGMERDIISGYGDVMVRWSRKLTNSEYVPQIDRALNQIRQEASTQSDPTIYAAAQNIMDQSAFFHNPNFNTFISAATTLSYVEYILGNISSALINITSLPMMVYPMLTGKYGWADATAAMTAASKTAMNDWSENARYKNLYNTLMDHAQLEHTMAREVLEGRRQKTSDYIGIKARILDGLSIPFAATEKYNRGVTAIAAYDLARKSGMNEEKAVRYALDTVKNVHTSGLAVTGPKWMQTPMGRLFFTFKSFVWNSAYVMARAFHQSFKGETREVREAAQRQLLATYGMATVFTGIKGMPFYGAVSVLAQMINSLFGDEEEPFDFDEFLRGIFGEFFYKGAFNYATNLEVANRAGIATDLLFRDDPRGVAEHGYVLSAMQQMFGPAGTIAVNTGNAVKMMQDGHTLRAIETVAPSFVRNVSKGMRYFAEGATTLKGDPVMEDISAYNSLMQGIGFTPADLSSQYERVQAAKGYEREVLARRTKLLQMYDMGHTAGDFDLMSETTEKIQAFNEAHANYKITPDTIRRSIKAREAAEKEMINGVRFNKKLRGEIEDRFFDEE